MYIVLIAWGYVALMMAVAEAANPAGTVLGAIVTFVLYGVLPVSILAYIMATPGRKRARRAREAALAQAEARASAGEPDAGGETAADPIAPVRKEP